MSNPVTNVEIEDVLSSIRRLVSDGDKARTRDPAPDAGDEKPVVDAPKIDAESGESKPDKLVLTPAFMVVDNAKTAKMATERVADAFDFSTDEGDQDDEWVEEIAAEPELTQQDASREDDAADGSVDDVAQGEDTVSDVESPDAVSDVTDSADMVWNSVNEARKAGLAALPDGLAAERPPAKSIADAQKLNSSAPDRSGLVASIAELEAAVSKDIEDFEPDGSEAADEVKGETIAWPGAVSRRFAQMQDAEVPEDEVPDEKPDLADDSELDDDAELDDAPLAFAHRVVGVTVKAEPVAKAPDTTDEEAANAEAPNVEAANEDAIIEDAADENAADVGATNVDATNQEATNEDATIEPDDFGDDDLDGLLEAGGVSIDEAALRALVSEVVREELTGPLGERITRNVRKLVRREIHRILSSQEFD